MGKKQQTISIKKEKLLTSTFTRQSEFAETPSYYFFRILSIQSFSFFDVMSRNINEFICTPNSILRVLSCHIYLKKKYNQNVFIETQREREKCDAFQVDATVLPHTLK